MPAISTVIWDWNGTLLNDMEACVRAMNGMLARRGLKSIDLETYREVFTFPVIDYYRMLGFDLEREDFDAVATEFHGLYFAALEGASLQPGAIETLTAFQNKRDRQIVLSATETESLKTQMGRYDLPPFFDGLLGADNLRAHGKIGYARDYFRSRPEIDPATVILIGDTRHDYEVAAALGCRCILVRNGHQNLDRFRFDRETLLVEDLSRLTAADCFRL
jgi:phosphoglycolate phosphatase